MTENLPVDIEEDRVYSKEEVLAIVEDLKSPGAMPLPEIALPEGFEHLDLIRYDFNKCPTRIDKFGPYFIDDVIAAIMVTHGNLAAMSALLGRSRVRIKDYVYKTPEALALLQDMDSAIVDNVEMGHTKLALSGDGAAQRFILGTKGKDRGYHKETTIVPAGQQDHSNNVQKINIVAPDLKTIEHDDGERYQIAADLESKYDVVEDIDVNVEGGHEEQLGLFDE